MHPSKRASVAATSSLWPTAHLKVRPLKVFLPLTGSDFLQGSDNIAERISTELFVKNRKQLSFHSPLQSWSFYLAASEWVSEFLVTCLFLLQSHLTSLSSVFFFTSAFQRLSAVWLKGMQSVCFFSLQNSYQMVALISNWTSDLMQSHSKPQWN